MSRRRRSYFLRLAAVSVAALLVGAFVLSAGAYVTMTRAISDCAGQDYDPSNFEIGDLDLSAYWMPDYHVVDFPSRDVGIRISAYFIPAGDGVPNAGAVIVVHGLAACKHSANALLPAGMLHQAGFNLLVIDLRDHGESSLEDGYHAAGTDEYRDVLGAWDWLLEERGLLPDRIGLYGYSMGGASVILAAGEEAGVAALWADSAFADIEMIIDARVEGLPAMGWMKPLALLYGRVFLGDNILGNRPLDALARLNERPLFIVHGDADTVVPVEHAYALRQAYPSAEFWELPAVGHVEAMVKAPDEYAERLVAFFSEHLN